MTLHCVSSHLRRVLRNPANYKTIQSHCNISSTSPTAITEKWDLLSAVCLERKPVITMELNSMEAKYAQLLSDIEFENSLKSDHELRHKKDVEQAELLKRGEDADMEQTLKQTAQDFEDACQEEVNKFQFSPRITEADKTKAVKSLDRKLDRSLLLVIEQKLGQKYVWTLPQGLRSDGETLRQAAERVLKENCGDKLKAQFIGNAPCGFYKYKYPKQMRSKVGNPVGAKVFFFKAFYVNGQVTDDKTKLNNFQWLGRDELDSSLPKEYHKSVAQFLIDEK